MSFDDYGMANARLAGRAGGSPDVGADAFLSAAAGRFGPTEQGIHLAVRTSAP